MVLQTFEVLPVTPDEILRILSSPTINETEKILDEIKKIREETLSKNLILVYAT